MIIFVIFIFLVAEHSMDQDVYGGYSKQQIGSLTTDGEGEFSFFAHTNHTCLEYSERYKKKAAPLTFGQHRKLFTCRDFVMDEKHDGFCLTFHLINVEGNMQRQTARKKIHSPLSTSEHYTLSASHSRRSPTSRVFTWNRLRLIRMSPLLVRKRRRKKNVSTRKKIKQLTKSNSDIVCSLPCI